MGNDSFTSILLVAVLVGAKVNPSFVSRNLTLFNTFNFLV